MGAWGYDSLENDAALDFISELVNEDIVKNLLKQKQPEYAELRAAGTVLVHLHKLNDLWFHKKTIDGLISKLESVLADEEWLNSWTGDGPEIVQKALRKLIKDLKKLDGYD